MRSGIVATLILTLATPRPLGTHWSYLLFLQIADGELSTFQNGGFILIEFLDGSSVLLRYVLHLSLSGAHLHQLLQLFPRVHFALSLLDGVQGGLRAERWLVKWPGAS